MANILLVDDHPLFREGFAQMARMMRPTWVVHLSAGAAHALAILATVALDLAIVDAGLPGDDGFALIKSIATQFQTLPLILISGRGDAGVQLRARASGVRCFIAKSHSPDVIAGHIDAVLAGKFTIDPPTNALPILTLRQTEVLMLLAAGHSNKEIRHKLDIAERTVRAHLTELFQLLGASSRMQALIRARELGLIG